MSTYSNKLSAYLDGELPAAEAQEIEAALEQDTALQAELEALMAVDAAVQAHFDDDLKDPVPLALAAAIQKAPDEIKTETSAEVAQIHAKRPLQSKPWLAIAAALGLLMIGGAGGYLFGGAQQVQVATGPGWLGDIADYHRVYAAQKRHLVEVDASEADHIETWLTASIGADVKVPDLSDQGLVFQGARLLVAAGKPVSQLIFTDAQGGVVALCQIQTPQPKDMRDINEIDGVRMVSWGGADANFVVVGDDARTDLGAIAEAVGLQV